MDGSKQNKRDRAEMHIQKRRLRFVRKAANRAADAVIRRDDLGTTTHLTLDTYNTGGLSCRTDGPETHARRALTRAALRLNT